MAHMFAWDKKIEEMDSFLNGLKKPNYFDIAAVQSGKFTDYKHIIDM